MENLQLRDSGRFPRSLSLNRCNPAGGCVPNVPQNLHECLQTRSAALLYSPWIILECPTQVNQHQPGALNRHRHAHVHRKGMRGGISMVSKRHAKANNPHTAAYATE